VGVSVPDLYLCSNVEREAASNVWTDESFVDLLFRVIFLFCILWVPAIMAVNIERSNIYDRNVPLNYISWYLGSLQAILTFSLALTKPDVRAAAENVWTCRWIRHNMR